MSGKGLSGILTCCMLISAVSVYGQIKRDEYFWVTFKDKEGIPYTLDKPQEYLSPQAIERRKKGNVPIEFSDLPVQYIYVKTLIDSGVTVRFVSKWFNAASVYIPSPEKAEMVAMLPFVLDLEPVKSTLIESIEEETEIVSMHRRQKESSVFSQYDDYGVSFNQIHMLNGDYLHALGFKGRNIKIAIFDAGFTGVNKIPAFEHLFEEGRVQGTFDLVDVDETLFNMSGHGTSVLSTMAGLELGGLIGTSPEATYSFFRTEDGSSEFRIEEDNWVRAAEMADSMGIDVINSSLGYSRFDDETQDYIYTLMDGNTTRITQASDLAARKVILVVSSAGNLGNNDWYYISAPADGDSVFTVGAVNQDRKTSSFSSRGPSVDGRVKPNVAAQGQNTVVLDTDGKLKTSNGTSFSSPIMAGMCASLLSAFPELTNMQVIQAVQMSASTFTTPNDTIGYGIPDFKKAYDWLKEKKQPGLYSPDYPFAFPNPFYQDVSVMFQAPFSDEYTIELYDSFGKLLLTETKTLSEGAFELLTFPAHFFPASGTYFVKIQQGGSHLPVLKLMKL